jgi:hypothetical protein
LYVYLCTCIHIYRLKKALAEEEETPSEKDDVNLNLIRKNLNCSDKSVDVVETDPAGGGVVRICIFVCIYIYIFLCMYVWMYICT